jgi:hypothetical protein
VNNRQQAKAQAGATEQAAQDAAFESQAQVAELQQQMAQMQQAPAPAAGGDDLTAKLMKLADLHGAGVLSDSGFADAKAKLLA